jgi:hypothetical protein
MNWCDESSNRAGAESRVEAARPRDAIIPE